MPRESKIRLKWLLSVPSYLSLRYDLADAHLREDLRHLMAQEQRDIDGRVVEVFGRPAVVEHSVCLGMLHSYACPATDRRSRPGKSSSFSADGVPLYPERMRWFVSAMHAPTCVFGSLLRSCITATRENSSGNDIVALVRHGPPHNTYGTMTSSVEAPRERPSAKPKSPIPLSCEAKTARPPGERAGAGELTRTGAGQANAHGHRPG